MYSSQDPTSVKRPAIAPMISAVVASSAKNDSDVTEMKAVTRVDMPASNDSAKAAVGLGSTFTAKAYPYKNERHEKYQPIVTLEGEGNVRAGFARAKRQQSKAIYCFLS